jgi:hypothetical protein
MNAGKSTMNLRVILVAAGCLGCLAPYAGAFDGYSPHFPWYGYGNNGPAAYALGNIPAPPYFALHPPVYYSHPLPRSYGRSPFACSCDCHHASRHAVSPRVVVNPHIQVRPKPAESPQRPVKVASAPQRIVNPFYAKPNRETLLGE